MTLNRALWFALLLAGATVQAKAPIHRAPQDSKRKDKDACFIVRLKDDSPSDAHQRLFEQMEGDNDRSHLFSGVFRGFSKCGARESQLEEFADNSLVLYIEEDQVATVYATQTVASDRWNLDRIDEHIRILDGEFIYERTGQGVSVYVVDTGVQGNHQDFGGRVEAGKDFVDSIAANVDCHGHGTHVAGTAAGALSGVAKDAQIIPVRVLNCAGSGTYSDIIAGLDWIRLQSQRKPAVINMSIGGSKSSSMNGAVANLVAAGYHVVVAAGNSAADACSYSPASAPDAITVGSSTSSDSLSYFSNVGSCVDLLAPGSGIYSADSQNLLGFTFKSGTSMASPIVAGVVATFLEANPSISPLEMANILKDSATVLSSLSADTPNLLLYSAGPVPGTTPEPVPDTSSSGSVPDPVPEPSPVLPPCPGNSRGNKNKYCIPASSAIHPNRRSGFTAPETATSAGRLQSFLWLGIPVSGLLALFALFSLGRPSEVAPPDPLDTLASDPLEGQLSV